MSQTVRGSTLTLLNLQPFPALKSDTPVNIASSWTRNIN